VKSKGPVRDTFISKGTKSITLLEVFQVSPARPSDWRTEIIMYEKEEEDDDDDDDDQNGDGSSLEGGT